MRFDDVVRGKYYSHGWHITVIGKYYHELGIQLECICGVSGEVFTMNNSSDADVQSLARWSPVDAFGHPIKEQPKSLVVRIVLAILKRMRKY